MCPVQTVTYVSGRSGDAILPGVEETFGYIDLRRTRYNEVVDLLASKLRARLG